MAFAHARATPRDIRVVRALAGAVVVAPLAMSLLAILLSGSNGSGAKRGSLLMSEARAAPAPASRGPGRSIAVNAQTPQVILRAPRGEALGEAAILPPAFALRAPVAQPAPAPIAASSRLAHNGALLRVASRGGPLTAPSALDGVRLESEGLVIRLAGVEPLAADATCRRLDGVSEPCAARATSRLAVLIQGRDVVCRLAASDGATEATGVCKAGKIDLAEDLVRAGLARRTGGSRPAGRATL